MAGKPRLWTTGQPRWNGAARADLQRSSGVRALPGARHAQPVDKTVDSHGGQGEHPMSQADLAEVWARSLEELSDLQIEPHQRAWLRLTRPLGLVENTALIATPNEFVKEQLETRLRGLITHALSREFGRSIQLAVTVDPATAAGGMPAPRDAAPPHPPGDGMSGQGISDRGTGGPGRTDGGHDSHAGPGGRPPELTGPIGAAAAHGAGHSDLPAENGGYPHPFGYPSHAYPPPTGHDSPGPARHPAHERDAAAGLL